MLEEIIQSPVPPTLPAPGSSHAPSVEVPGTVAKRAQLGVAMLFLVNGAAIGSWVPHIPERAAALHLNPAQLGEILLAAGIGALFAMPVSGPLLRRFGSRKVCIVAGLLFPALLTLAILLPSVPLLVGVLFLTGLNAAAMDVAMNSHAVLVEAVLRKRTISLLHAIFSLGCFGGAGIHSFFMAQHTAEAILIPCSGAVLLVTVLAAIPLLLPKAVEDARSTAESDIALPKTAEHKGLRALLPAHLPHPGLLLLGTLCFSTMVSEGAMGDWSALFLRVVRHLPNGTSGYGYTCFAGLMVVGRFFGDAAVARIGEMRALRIGGLVSVAGMLMILFVHPLAGVLLGFALAGLGLANASPVLYRTAATLPGFAPGEGLATAVGVGYAGLLIGPPLLGILAHKAGLPSIFWVLLLLSATLSGAAPLCRSKRVMGSRHAAPSV